MIVGRFGFGIPWPPEKARKEKKNAGCAGGTRSPVRSVSLSVMSAYFETFVNAQRRQKSRSSARRSSRVLHRRSSIGGKVLHGSSLASEVGQTHKTSDGGSARWRTASWTSGCQLPETRGSPTISLPEQKEEYEAPDVEEACLYRVQELHVLLRGSEAVVGGEAARKDSHGSLSMVALIVKTKQNATVKRRCEQQVVCRKRIVLLRAVGAIRDFRCLVDSEAEPLQKAAATGQDMESPSCEVVSAEFSEAYVEWHVDPRERSRLCTATYKGSWRLQWLFLCFVLRAAPLLWCRVSAAAGRMLQYLLPA